MGSYMAFFIALVVAFVGTVSAAQGQSAVQPEASHVSIETPWKVRELAPGFRFDVFGENVIAPLHRLLVRLNDQPINGSITLTPSAESRADENGDGVLEFYRVTYELAWNAVDPAPGDIMTIFAEIPSPTGLIAGRVAVPILGHLETILTDFVEGTGSAAAPAKLDVFTFDATVTAQNVNVYVGGQDVTALVNISGPFTHDDFMSPTNPLHVDYRSQHYEIDFSPLAPAAPTQATVEVMLFTPKGTTTSSASGVAVEAGVVDAWQRYAIELCLIRMKIKKENGGKVKIGATAKEVKKAIDQLQQNLDPSQPSHPDNPTPGPGTPAKSNKEFPGGEQTMSDLPNELAGIVVVVAVAQANKDAKASDSAADVVLAVGGDASGTGKKGGNANATNDHEDGVAIAAGGDGHFNLGAGNGSAVARPNGGTALGIGGNSMPTPSSDKHPGTGAARVTPSEGSTPGNKETGGGGFEERGETNAHGHLTDRC